MTLIGILFCEQSFNNWIVHQFEKSSNLKKLDKLEVDITEGGVFPDLVEIITGKKVSVSTAGSTSRERKLQVVTSCLEVLRKDSPQIFGTDINVAGIIIFPSWKFNSFAFYLINNVVNIITN